VELPKIRLELLEDISPRDDGGFLRLVRRRYRAHYPDGSQSAPFVYDAIARVALDAVVIAAHFCDVSGNRRVYLRSAVRPPLLLRAGARSPIPDEATTGGLWELPAGLVEAAEQSPDGVVRTAQRELLEELGFDALLKSLHELGKSTFPAPGFIAERHFFFEVSVDPSTRRDPELDGSALEQFGEIVDVSLVRALEMCKSGSIEDAKTELALRRLAERYA
jgi:ADP-ribose pyrophosphatase